MILEFVPIVRGDVIHPSIEHDCTETLVSDCLHGDHTSKLVGNQFSRE